MAKIIPAILTDGEEEYHKRLLLAEHVSDLIQIDIVDGNFAKNKTVGLDVVKKYPSSSSLEEEYHKRLLLAEHVSDLIQIDIVDGNFAKNKTVGLDVVKKYPSSSSLE